MCAALLELDGYQEIDPQSPLGGPDGTKDILCSKGGKKALAAVFFPPTPQTHAKVAKKFKADLKGARKNRVQGFIFFVNRSLSPGERAQLISHAKDIAVEIYHLERIRTLLDSPKGCGVRLEYLRIA